MVRSGYFKLFSLLTALFLIFELTGYNLTFAKAAEITATPTPTPNLTPLPSLTPTPMVKDDADPVAWLDGALDMEQFPPKGALTVHFNAPMLTGSSPNPVLVWPALKGIASWNDTNTILTFQPDGLLDSKKTYTFFLDPALRSAAGKELKDAPEWVVHVQSGPSVITLQPAAGALDLRSLQIEITFDRAMQTTSNTKVFSITPEIPFEITWASERILRIKLERYFEYNQRYDLSLGGGGGENSLFAADGTYLPEDYHWFYAQSPFTATATVTGGQTVEVNFNVALEQKTSNLSFSISPALPGEWKWISATKVEFTAFDTILASQEYKLAFTKPLVDHYGIKTTIPPTLSFSGLPPIHLIGTNLKRNEYNENDTRWYVDADTESIQVEFATPVDHASAEKAFSLDPAAPGKFTWKQVNNSDWEILTYTFDDLLKTSNEYTIQIDTTLVDRQGQPVILQPYEEAFHATAPSGPTFGQYGENIQVIDADGPRQIQFGGNTDGIYFAAYKFDLVDFTKLYAAHFNSSYYSYYDSNKVQSNIPIPNSAKPVAVWSDFTKRVINTYNEIVIKTTLPDALVPGLYVLNTGVKNRLYDQIFLVVTRNTLVVKEDVNGLFVWLTSINGKNVPDAEISVYTKSGEKISAGKTDANGQYRVPIPVETELALVSARTQGKDQSEDVTLSGFAGWSSSTYGRYYYRPSNMSYGQPYLIYLYTERPIYRPGQKVNFKALVRKDNDLHYEVPKVDTPVKIRVMDARSNLIESFELRTNDFGTVNGSFTVSEGAMLGSYKIESEVEGITNEQSFKVEDYRKPDYQIKLTSLQPEKKDIFARGEEIKMQINASYYFGEPLANTKLDVKFYHYWGVKTSIKGSLITDDKGNATISFDAPFDTDDNNYAYYYGHNGESQTIRMEVTANDGSNQTVTGLYYFRVYYSATQLRLDTGGYYFTPNKPTTITAHSVDLRDEPLANQKLTLTVSPWNWNRYDFDATSQTYELQTDAQGKATQDITLTSGYYKLILSGKDALGNNVDENTWVYAFKDGDGWFQRDKSQYLSISADKDSYKPDEKARFAIESTFSGPALLSFERGSVIHTQMIKLTAPLTIIEMDVLPEYAPNVYVTVNAWQAASANVERHGYSNYAYTQSDSYLRMDSTKIMVDSSDKALDISIQTDKKTYAPGEKVNATVHVKDAHGKPVVAELSLAVVDEAIFALANDNSANIFDSFYGPRWSSVDTYDSMAPYRVIFDYGGGRGGGGDEPPTVPRSDFLDTSTWLPVVRTDENGQAIIPFDLPDNTTSWRLTVKAITLNHLVGTAQSNIETKKEVFVRPSLPRALTTGDTATLTTFVHNYSTSTQSLRVSMAADGLELQGEKEQQVTLRAGAVRAVGWRVRVSGAKPTEVTISVQGKDGPLDAVRLPLLLQPVAVKDVQNQSGQFSGTLTLALPLPKVERQTSQVRLTLNRTMSGTLLNGLDYLTGYPYGCVEQTMSRALPNAVVGRAGSQLGIGGPAMQTRLDPLIKAGIQKLYGLQHTDGGWGWWVDDDSDAYETAWVLFGLGLMNDSGYSIEPKVMDNAAEWLDRNTNSSRIDIRTRAYALYSLAEAGRGNKEGTLTLAAESARSLDPFSQAVLALALDRLDEKEQAKTVLALLSQSVVKKGDQVYWPQPSYDGEYHQKTMASTIRTTALALLAYTRIDPKSDMLPGVVNYLASQRRGIYGWGTTNETSFTILALTEYLKSQEDTLGATPYEAIINGKHLFQGTLQRGNTSASLDIPMDALKDGLNTLLVTTQGDHPLYFDLSTRYDLVQVSARAAGKLSVTRHYLDPQTDKPLTDIHAGQLVKVQLDVNTPQMASFMAVEDYLPGGLEALNEGLNTVSEVSYNSNWGTENYRRYYWQDYGYNYKEIRGDRVVFFITTFKQGFHRFIYYARATTTGQFATLPTQAYAMYDPAIWGRSEGGKIVIK